MVHEARLQSNCLAAITAISEKGKHISYSYHIIYILIQYCTADTTSWVKQTGCPAQVSEIKASWDPGNAWHSRKIPSSPQNGTACIRGTQTCHPVTQGPVIRKGMAWQWQRCKPAHNNQFLTNKLATYFTDKKTCHAKSSDLQASGRCSLAMFTLVEKGSKVELWTCLSASTSCSTAPEIVCWCGVECGLTKWRLQVLHHSFTRDLRPNDLTPWPKHT